MPTPYSPSDFPIGTVVSGTDIQRDIRLGHVTGFARNATGEVILKVSWDDGEESTIHPAAITHNPTEWPRPWSQQRCVDRMAQEAEAKASEKRGKPRWRSRWDAPKLPKQGCAQ